jgi:hypothetical protein
MVDGGQEALEEGRYLGTPPSLGDTLCSRTLTMPSQASSGGVIKTSNEYEDLCFI